MAHVLRTIPRHMRRYPGWYPLVIGWAIAMVLLPVLRDSHAAGRSTAAPAAQVAVRSDAGLALSGPANTAPAPPPTGAAVPAPSVGERATAATPAGPPSASPAPAGPDAAFHLPQLPAIPIPALPAELNPALQLASPLATTACAPLGLARIGLDTVAPALGGVPVEEILGYFVPVYTACGLPPEQITSTTCAIDQTVAAQEPAQLVGIYTVPSAAGLTVDEIAAFDALVAPFGAPSLTSGLAPVLDCDVHDNR
jgi:hypothetical protein